MAAETPVVFYRYDGSPFSDKIDNVLLLKGIPHRKVDVRTVSMTLPRPEISDLLGVSYRRIPVLAIGNDVYCDTSLIASALEHCFPKEKGYGTLFPARSGTNKVDTGMIKAFCMYYADRPLFSLAAACLPYNKFPPKFLEDRAQFQGSKQMNVEAAIARQPMIKSTLSSHMELLEEQLSDGREWLFDTVLPSFADIAVHFPYFWVRHFRGMKDILPESKFPKSIAWISRISDYLNSRKAGDVAPSTKITGDAAAKVIVQAQPLAQVGFDTEEAHRLGVHRDTQVSVAPDDTGRTVLTHGVLVGLNREEAVIETQGSAGKVRCHFPMLNFTIRPSKASKL
ncbi:hypothetical protein BD410DRAFT_817606 [Rickenella mellea]|uniref:Uncharacterized protein n=1 Tax=Rickenella mellea TaxID=50990 RepID=A0A4R5XEJ9_9AGAM|nr:hypothetical protein BD410DRAFT_817606 [Rickenella mellea]